MFTKDLAFLIMKYFLLLFDVSYNKVIINITSIDTSVQHFISHVESCFDTGINIYITKGLLINITLNDNILLNAPANMVNGNKL